MTNPIPAELRFLLEINECAAVAVLRTRFDGEEMESEMTVLTEETNED